MIKVKFGRFGYHLPLTAVVVVIISCDQNYHIGSFSKSDVIGTWTMTTTPPSLDHSVNGHDSSLVLFSNGTFESRNFPIIKKHGPPLDIDYVNDKGSWRLDDMLLSATTSKWMVVLNFDKALAIVRIPILGSNGAFKLFCETDLDSQVGFEYERAGTLIENRK